MALSIKQFAQLVGKTAVKVKTAADAFHIAYTKATPEQQSQLRVEWMVGHLAGQGVNNPERTFSLGKGKGSTRAGRLAIDRAYSDFRYYVVRPVKGKAEPKKHKRLAPELRAAAMTFLGEFKGETLGEQITAAIALLNKMK